MLRNRLRVHLFLLSLKVNRNENILHRRKLMSDDWHTATVTVPLSVALMVRSCSEIVPYAILKFCQIAPNSQNSNDRRVKKDLNNPSKSPMIPFENLVCIALTLPKTMYAMLLTGGGLLPPPMKIPKGYSSLEVKRWKRNNLANKEGQQKFRHALEVGMRLTLGLEWILSGSGFTKDKSRVKAFSVPERVSHFHARVDIDSRGNGKWIRDSWHAGPQEVPKEGTRDWQEGDIIDIGALTKYPVWDPEIVDGGLYPRL